MRDQRARKSRGERILRIGQVSKMILEGDPTGEIIKFCITTWQVTERTGHNYIRRAREGIQEIVRKDSEEMLAEAIARLELLFERAYREGKYKVCLEIIKTKLDRLMGKPRQTVQVENTRELPKLPSLSSSDLDLISRALYGGDDDRSNTE